MGGSLHKWYQDEALMEGKKTTTSILPLAIDLREIERRRSKKQWKKNLGWAGTPLSQEIARRGGRRRKNKMRDVVQTGESELVKYGCDMKAKNDTPQTI